MKDVRGGTCVMNRKQEKKEPKPVPQSANYLDPKIYEELVRAANNLAEAVFRKTDWKSIFKKINRLRVNI